MGTHYLNGNWVSKDQLNISIFDLTFLRGYGLFEFLRTYDRKPFGLDAHLDRFEKGAKGLELPMVKSKAEIRDIVIEGIKRNPEEGPQYKDLYIKLYLTGGISEDAMTSGEPSLIVVFLSAKEYPPHNFTDGIKLISTQFERFLPEFKSLNYMTAVFFNRKAKKEGASEVLYYGRDGNILEGSTFNFFAVKNGEIYTALDDVLEGITRKFLLEVAAKQNVKVNLAPLFMKDLTTFDETFITSTTREVCPVVQIDNLIIGDGKVGKITQLLMKSFKDTL